MRNFHKLFSDWDKTQAKVLEEHGIKIELGYFSFWMDENKLYWKLKPYFDKWKATDTVISKFSLEEENAAKRLILFSPWANGYPMPDIDNGYKKTTYDDSDYCKVCGIGLKQKEPFRIKKAPNWSGQKLMFSLNWVHDEYFVKKEFYEEVFNPIRLKSEKVLLYKKDTVILDTVQLIIPQTEVSLNLERYKFEECKECNRKRYDLINRGFFPSFNNGSADMQIFKSKEWFGTGASARKYIFISQELREVFVGRNIAATYVPCDDKYTSVLE